MKLNSNFLSGAVGVFVGVVSSVAVTAYGIGLEKAAVVQNTKDVQDIKLLINNKLDQIDQSLNQLKTDVEVLKTIVTRIERKQ